MSPRGICQRCDRERSIYARGHCKPCREVMLNDGTWDAVPKARTLKDPTKVAECQHCGSQAYMFRSKTCYPCWKRITGVSKCKPAGNRHYQRLSGANDVALWPSPIYLECCLGILWECHGVGEFEGEACYLATVGSERMWIPRLGLAEPRQWLDPHDDTGERVKTRLRGVQTAKTGISQNAGEDW